MKKKTTFIIIAVLLIAAIACFIGIITFPKVNNFNEPEKQKQINFSMRLDFSREQIPTSITLDYTNIWDKPAGFSEIFATRSNDEYLNAFKTCIRALDENSINELNPLLFQPKKKTLNKPEVILKHIHRNFKKMQSEHKELFLLKRIKGKDQQVFIWGAKKDDGSLDMVGNIFMKQAGEVVWFWPVNPKRVLNAFFFMLRDDKTREAPVRPADAYQYSLMLTDEVNSQMFTLLFNGKIYEEVDLGKIESNNDRFISLYLDSIKALERSKEEYAKFWTKRSGDKFLEYMKRYPFMFERIKKENKNKIISFIMDAKPFYLVFYRRRNSKAKHFDKFDYIYETKDGLKFTNNGCFDFVDYVFRCNVDKLQELIFPTDNQSGNHFTAQKYTKNKVRNNERI
jgi:hypothetical protein